MKNTNIHWLLMGALMLPAISANSLAHKPMHPKRKITPFPTSHKSSAFPVVDTWKPDPKLVNDLAEETTAGNYNLRLPEGYTELPRPPAMNSPSLAGFDSHFYSINRRSDGTAATIAFIVATPPTGTREKLTLDDALKGTLQEKESHWQDFTKSSVQDGRINGIAFERVYFKGIVSGKAGTRPAHGFVYVAIDGNSILNFQAEDVEPYNDETIVDAQASVLTLRKQANP